MPSPYTTQYPNSVATFPLRENIGDPIPDYVMAEHMNAVQAEIAAIQARVGAGTTSPTDPRTPAVYPDGTGPTATTIHGRLYHVEEYKADRTHHHTSFPDPFTFSSDVTVDGTLTTLGPIHLGSTAVITFGTDVVSMSSVGSRDSMQWNFDGHGMFMKDHTGGGDWSASVIISKVISDTTNKGLCLWSVYGNLSPIIKTDSGGAGGTSGVAGANWYNYGFQFRDQADAAWVKVSASGFVVPSSERYKENIDSHSVGLDAVMALRPVKFQLKNEPQPVLEQDPVTGEVRPSGEMVTHAAPPPELGLIAEEMHEAGLTDVVLYEDDKPAAYSLNGMVSVLVKAVQEQQEMINDLRSEIAALKG